MTNFDFYLVILDTQNLITKINLGTWYRGCEIRSLDPLEMNFQKTYIFENADLKFKNARLINHDDF